MHTYSYLILFKRKCVKLFGIIVELFFSRSRVDHKCFLNSIQKHSLKRAYEFIRQCHCVYIYTYMYTYTHTHACKKREREQGVHDYGFLHEMRYRQVQV